jgi:hypothetical protein
MATSQGFSTETFAEAVFVLDLVCDRSNIMDMDKPHEKYKFQIADAWAELTSYEQVQRIIERKVTDLRDLIRATANFLPDQERANELVLLDMVKHPSNITEAVRMALFIARGTGERLTPTDIRQRAEQRGFNFSEYTNPLASIHTILRRMKDSNPPEVEVDESDGTYLLVVGKPGEMSPEYLEKTRNKIWRKIVDKTVDPAMMERLFGEITAEVIDDDFKKTKRKEISE